MGSMEMTMSAEPCGMRSEAMGVSDIRRWLCTSPPRWLMPCTSACLMNMPRDIAASPIIVAMERMPCPPTPESMMSFFMLVVCGLLFVFLFGFACECLDAFAARDYDGEAVVVEFLLDGGGYGVHVFWEGLDDEEVVAVESESEADGFVFVEACGVLSAGHGSGEVVGYDDCHWRVGVYGVEESGHAGVCEGGVADYGYDVRHAGVGCAFGHGDAGSHVDAAVEGAEGWQCAEGVASYVAEDFGVGVGVVDDFVECVVYAAVSAALA